ncbi:hypothetical protein Pmani_002911 [Petrolisthes manimaculis]|uniref:Uncharacterized protein n=1 Tax=Petrolisthes manimaculis TaxID=1843537 RepID=A0AAE1U5S2_9EUCA|nr:hypothetical protein Pmani_037371 [Petrolisthes manimaculis]KAK4307265.1 hypothetical protein Pmani_020978 [Petrolisthes manimaculis]KAK4322044.1 hypothetical protein Pmani_007163 [Petrolisthes manimaculis]KAK4326597.1 hypothetical protein Pmani_002911 [Petrolisthes manimaculis]
MSSISEIMKTAQLLGMSPEVIEKLVQQEIYLQKDKAEREERCAEGEQRKLELKQKQLEVGQRSHECDLTEAEKVRIEAEKARVELRLAELHSAAGPNEVPNNHNPGQQKTGDSGALNPLAVSSGLMAISGMNPSLSRPPTSCEEMINFSQVVSRPCILWTLA